MNATVFTICFNEEFILPHFIAHYRKMFPGCRIIIYDNESTDRSREIALAADCEVITYNTGSKLDDNTYLKIKNSCWKSTKGWVIICDCDEFCDISAEDLCNETKNGTSIIKFRGFNMVNLADTMNFNSIKSGIRAPSYDKNYCFNSNDIMDMGYQMGCHAANPFGDVHYSEKVYNCRHYKYINPDYMVSRHQAFAARLSDENIKRGYGGHYLYTEQQIRAEFEEARKQAKKL